MRSIGLHLRLQDSFLAIVKQAHELHLPIFQCFFIGQNNQESMQIPDEEVEIFLKDYRASFSSLYLHGSYWINLANTRSSRHKVFFREYDLAQKLAFDYMILHPGAATGARNRTEGIDALARFLNTVCAQEMHIKLVLENTAHAGISIGGNLQDFKQLLEKLDHPERIFFCVDTAHAYSYGYDVHDAVLRESFIQELGTILGYERIVLLHLNDTKERLGSRIDKHEIPGQGNIGADALRVFVADKRLAHANIILELPVLASQQELQVYQKVVDWQKESELL